jgi:beta-glucosidase
MLLTLVYTLLALTAIHGFTLRTFFAPHFFSSQDTHLPCHAPGTWDQAYALANATVANLTLIEKVGLLAGVGQFSSRCVGNTTPVSRLGLPAICFQDGPAGVRLVKNVTGFPTGINTAATFSRRLMQARGQAMAEEFRAKGVQCVYSGFGISTADENPTAFCWGRPWISCVFCLYTGSLYPYIMALDAQP